MLVVKIFYCFKSHCFTEYNYFLHQVPPSENSKLMSFGSNHQYLECIKAAYNFASSELLNLINDKVSFNINMVTSFSAYILILLQ